MPKKTNLLTWAELKERIDDELAELGYLDNEVHVHLVEVVWPLDDDDFEVVVEDGELSVLC